MGILKGSILTFPTIPCWCLYILFCAIYICWHGISTVQELVIQNTGISLAL